MTSTNTLTGRALDYAVGVAVNGVYSPASEHRKPGWFWPRTSVVERRSQLRRNGVRWTAGLCPDGRERKTMKLTQAISRANSHFRYWNYRKTIGKPFPLRFAVAQWFRRLAFELAGIGSGA